MVTETTPSLTDMDVAQPNESPSKPNRVQVWSCGGGTQSAAIGALIALGHLPKPDLSIIVDTEREMSSTWDYFDRVLYPQLLKVGVEIVRVSKSQYASVDLWGGESGDSLLIPAFTTKAGRVSKLPTYCSNEWKVRVLQRYCNEKFPDAVGFDQWLGISRDESHRMRTGHQGKWQYKHPLVDDGRLMSRQDCIKLVESIQWGTPPRSRCWMCPNQSQGEWSDMRENYPSDFAKAIMFDGFVRSKDKHAFVHSSGKPLSEMAEDNPDLFDGDCMSGMCYV